MFKKLIARILVLTLLMQCVPAEALADVGKNGLLLSQQELDRISAQYDLDSMDSYHDGMAYSSSFNLEQVIGYLYYLQYSKIEPLSNTVEMLIDAIAEVGPLPKEDQIKLETLDAFMFNLHKIKDEITGSIDALEQSVTDIHNAANRVWDTENYSFAQRAGYSSRVKKAQERIDATRSEIDNMHADWETNLENSEQAIRNDGNMNVYISNANDGSFVSFEPIDASNGKARKGANGDGWQLRDLYAELKQRDQDQPKLFTVSAADLGLKSSPSLLERLSPISTAYADRQQDATVTVIDDNQFAVEARDANGAPIAGMTVRAIDAAKMYEKGTHTFVEAKTDENGAAVFDIPGNFTLDVLDKLNLYIEYLPDAPNGEQPGYQGAYLWNVYIDRGTSYQYHFLMDVGEPYVASVCYNSQDVTQNIATFYYNANSNLTHRCFVRFGNADTETGHVFLCYSLTDPGSPTKETDRVKLTPEDHGYATAEITGPFGRMFVPGQPIYLVYEDAAHSGKDAIVTTLNVDIEAGQLPSPFNDTMKPFSLDTNILFNCNIPFDFSAIPGATLTAPQVGLDMPFNIPRLSVTFVPRGSISATLGFDIPGDYWISALHWNKEWPKNPSQDPPVETTEGGPDRPTEENSETGGEKHGKVWQFFLGKIWDDFGTKWQNFQDFVHRDKDESELKYPGGFWKGGFQVEVFCGFMGKIQNIGEDAEKGTLATLNANAFVGATTLISGDIYYQGTLFFGGFSWSVEVSAVYTWGLAQDLYWTTKGDISSTVDDYELVGKMRSAHSNDIFNLNIKIQIEPYCGIGVHGFAEISLHGYFYLAFTMALYTDPEGPNKVNPPYKLKNPHFTISFGGGIYILLKFIIFRVRFDLTPKEWERNIVFYSTWPHEMDLKLFPWMKEKEEELEREAGMSNLSSANPALAAARAAQAEAAEEETQAQSSIPAVYNSDLLVDTKTPILKGLETLNGKVAYARISGGKYKNPDDTAVHTYAFFLVNNADGYPRLSYIDLDAQKPQVFTFDEHPGYSIKQSLAQNSDAEKADTRGDDRKTAPYDYDFAVASVEDYNKLPKSDGDTSFDGMSAVVCVLSCTELKDVQIQTGDDTQDRTVTVKQQSGDIYATGIVVTRIDAKTGRLSMVISNDGRQSGDALFLKSSKKMVQMTDFSADNFENPQITAAFENATFGEDPETDKTKSMNCNRSVYSAAVMFQPRSAGNKDGTNYGPTFRYGASVNDDDKWLKLLYSDYRGDLWTMFSGTYMRFLYMERGDWMKHDANGTHVWVPDGKTINTSLLPFDGSNINIYIRWIETRGIKDSDRAQLVLFHENNDSQHRVYWMPLSPANLDTLIGRTGMGVIGHVTPWNADPNNDVAFFFYADDKGQTYLDSVRLSDGVLTDYDLAVPAADMGCVDTGESIIFYWPTSHAPADLEGGEKGACYAIKYMIYEKASGVLFAPAILAEIDADEETPPAKTFMTEDGTCYFALTGKSTEEISGTGVSTSTGTTTLDFYKFQQEYTMGLEFLSANFQDGAVRQGAYDDILMLMRNNGNVPISGFTMEVYDVDENGNERLMETIDANLTAPAESTVTYTGLVDGNARTEKGEKVVSVAANAKTRTRGEWAVTEATPNQIPNPDVLPSDWDIESTYLSTNSLMPLDMTTLEAPILIGANWKGKHTIRFKIKQLRSPNVWAVDLEGNEMRAARNAARNGANALRDTREVAVTRMDNGLTAVHYADEEPQSGSVSLIDMLLGREAPSAPPHYNASIVFDEIDLDTDAEDLTLDMRHYTRPSDGMEMVQLTAHNIAHEDNEPKCVVLYAYGDYSYEDVWPVYDFGDLNAGQSVTVTLPLSVILAGHNVNTLLLDLHVDHTEARKHGVSALKNHKHDGSDIYNGCRHDVNLFNDYVEVKLVDLPLQIVQQPADVHTLTDGEASFSVSVRGGVMPYTYQWQVRKPKMNKDGSHQLDKDGKWMYGDWMDWTGGTAITLDLVATAEMNGWQFHVNVTDMYGSSVTSAFATLRLTDMPKTGDDARPELWAVLTLAAMIAMMAVTGVPRKIRREKR